MSITTDWQRNLRERDEEAHGNEGRMRTRELRRLLADHPDAVHKARRAIPWVLLYGCFGVLLVLGLALLGNTGH